MKRLHADAAEMDRPVVDDRDLLDRVTSLLLLMMYAHEEAGRLNCPACQRQLRLGAKALIIRYGIVETFSGSVRH